MHAIPLLLLTIFCSSLALASSYVHGHVRSDGVYAQPHYRSSSDGSFGNNWMTRGNVNLHTGKSGTRVTQPSNYGANGSYDYRYGQEDDLA